MGAKRPLRLVCIHMFTIHMHNTYIYLHFKHCFATKWSQSIWWNAPGISGLLLECPLIRDGGDGVLQRFEVYLKTQVFGFYVVLCLFRWYCTEREGVQRRHDPRKNDLRVSGFAELPPGPAKLVSQPQWRHQDYRHSVSTPRILGSIKKYLAFIIYLASSSPPSHCFQDGLGGQAPRLEQNGGRALRLG